MPDAWSALSVGQALKTTAGCSPCSDAVTEDGLQWSWPDLDEHSDEYARYFLSRGVRREQFVAMMAHTSARAVAALLGLMKIGATPVMISPALNREQVAYELALAQAGVVIPFCSEAQARIPEGVTVLPDAVPEQDGVSDRQLAEACDGTDPRRSGIVLFTSGTSNRPKAVFLSQAQLLGNARMHQGFMHITPEDRIAAALPVEHILGLIITVLLPLVSGAAMCICAGRHTSAVLNTIQRERCTVLCGVPSMFHTIVSRLTIGSWDISSLRIGLTGGAPCSRELFARIEERLGILLISTLGQTETTGGFTRYDPLETAEDRRTSVGVPSPFVEVAIRNARGERMPPDTDGEICVRGAQVCSGYLNNPEATRTLLDSDGWLHTGDVGQMDSRGVIRVTGRMKDIIIRCGENISAVQVGEVIEACPGVQECRVIGIPDEHSGEELCACVIRSGAVSEEEIRRFTAARLESFKVPRYIFFFEAFARTGVGKPILGELKKEALRRLDSLQK